MIHLKTKVHDSQTLEFKIGYETEPNLSVSEFKVDLWMFIPGNLEANERTYAANTFYEDLKTRLRLITPHYTLEQLTEANALPYCRLQDAMRYPENLDAFRHEICMICNILKSSLRDDMEKILNNTDHTQRVELLDSFIQTLRKVMNIYHNLAKEIVALPSESRRNYQRGDEFLCQTIRHYLYCRTKEFNKKELNLYLLELQNYMESQGYSLPQPKESKQSRDFLHRYATLKKFIESDLYIRTHNKHSGFLLEQLMFMLSAGMAMGFALMINFYTKDAANKFSLPLILLMIVSYMFKDRIKDWVRNLFHDRSGEIFFDRRQRLEMNGIDIGSSRQNFEYLTPDKVAQSIQEFKQRSMELDEPDHIQREEVVHYCRTIRLRRKLIQRLSRHPLRGVDEICRLNLNRLMRWMDNPNITVYRSAEDGNVERFNAPRTYEIHFVMENILNGKSNIFSYRVELNRDGIIALKDLS